LDLASIAQESRARRHASSEDLMAMAPTQWLMYGMRSGTATNGNWLVRVLRGRLQPFVD